MLTDENSALRMQIMTLTDVNASLVEKIDSMVLQISELQNALKFATDFIDPDVGPSPYSNKSITVTLRKILAEYGKFAEKPQEESRG